LPTFLAGRSLSKNLNVRVEGCKPDRRSFEVNAGKVASRPSGEVFDGAEAGRDVGAGGAVFATCPVGVFDGFRVDKATSGPAPATASAARIPTAPRSARRAYPKWWPMSVSAA
jgi:hypothetical protein